MDAGLTAVDGVVEALDRITTPTCVASSGTHEKLRHTLGHTGLYERFAGRIFRATEVARGKPAPLGTLIGERQQGTLEPMLTTPIRPGELLLGKAVAVLLPALAVAYLVYGLFLACVELFAAPAVAAARNHGNKSRS